MKISSLVDTPAWQSLIRHHHEISGLHLRELFAADPQRGSRFTASASGLFLDYSKNRITEETVSLLCALAEQRGLRERIDAMLRGDKINTTENRSVLHVALRAPRGAGIMVDGEDVVPHFYVLLDRMAVFG